MARVRNIRLPDARFRDQRLAIDVRNLVAHVGCRTTDEGTRRLRLMIQCIYFGTASKMGCHQPEWLVDAFDLDAKIHVTFPLDDIIEITPQANGVTTCSSSVASTTKKS